MPSMPYSTPRVSCISALECVVSRTAAAFSIKRPSLCQGKDGRTCPSGLSAITCADAVSAHLAVQMAALEAEQLRGLHDVPFGLGEFLEDEPALEVLAAFAERLEVVLGLAAAPRLAAQPGRHGRVGDRLAGRENDQ